MNVLPIGTILGIWAHPDDETFSSAGLMYLSRQNSQRVVCVTATKGEKGSFDETRWPSATLGEVRAQELESALDLLGVTEHHWLGYLDGECDKVDETEATAKIRQIIDDISPDNILTFEPNGITGHPDHRAVSRWTTLALQDAKYDSIKLYHAVDTIEWYEKHGRELDKKFNIYFATDKPNLVPQKDLAINLTLDQKVLAIKARALKLQTSQTEGMINELGDIEFMKIIPPESFIEVTRL